LSNQSTLWFVFENMDQRIKKKILHDIVTESARLSLKNNPNLMPGEDVNHAIAVAFMSALAYEFVQNLSHNVDRPNSAEQHHGGFKSAYDVCVEYCYDAAKV